MQELLASARAAAGGMTGLLRALVEIESPSTEPAAVARLAERVARELDGLGLDVSTAPVPGTGPLLRARPRGGAGPAVLLLGHLDTVWPLGTLRQRPLRQEGPRLYGPGAFDMKGGLVVAIEALRLLAGRPGGLPAVGVLFTPNEEVGCAPYRTLMEGDMRAASAVLGFEPAWPGGAVKTERKGSGRFVIRARGVAAHAGADFDRGRNAILELARRLLEVAGLTDRARGVTVNVGVVRGGVRPNVVPDLAEAEVDFRVRTVDDGRRIEQAVRALRADDPGVALEIEGGLNYPPLERGPHVLHVFHAAQEAARSLGLELAEVATGGASEASFAAALGVPTLDGLGADGDGAHAVHEHVLLPSLPERAALAAALILRLAGSPIAVVR